jgi:hypothetical protein
MKTMIKVRNGEGPGSGSDIHIAEKGETPKDLTVRVNQAIKANDRLVTLDVDGSKKLSVIAENVEAIWEE